MSNRKFDNFDGFVSKYRANHTDNVKQVSGVDSDYFSEYKAKEVMLSENKSQNTVLLDFGCGDGNSSQYLLKYLVPDSYYGIDISFESIKVAQKLNLEHCHFQHFDGERIPFDDDTFDIVFMANVLHHVESEYHIQIIRECYRVLKKGGRLYIFEHNHLNPITRKIVNDCEFDVDAVLVPANSIKRTTKAVGFLSFKIRYTIFFPRKFIFKHLVPFEKYLRWCILGGQFYVKCTK